MITNLRTRFPALGSLFAALALGLSLALAFVLGFGGSTAFAQANGITMDEAERIALQHVPNATVESIERDYEGRTVVYEVELRTQQGVEHELTIDATDGHVIRAEIDD